MEVNRNITKIDKFVNYFNNCYNKNIFENHEAFFSPKEPKSYNSIPMDSLKLNYLMPLPNLGFGSQRKSY